MGDSDTEIPLLERAELPALPTVPKEAQQDLATLERDFVNAEVQLMRQAIPIMRPLYARRNELVASKLQEADFWPRVFANASPEIDQFIRPSDAQIIGSCLKNMTIDRFEVNEKGEGEPGTMRFVFEFNNGEENTWFEESKIVKEFYWRKQITKSPTGRPRIWEGLVSDPVRIKWKQGMDPTQGLLDAACDLADAEKAILKKESKDKLSAEERMKLPEYEKLAEKKAQLEEEVENAGEGDDEEGESSPAGVSFFAWFGYRGKDVTAAESEAAAKKIQEIQKGPEEERDDEDDDEDDALDDAEIFPDGENLALSFGEDLWPNALKFYVQSYEIDKDMDFDLDDLDDLASIDEEEEDEEEDKDEDERPRKKART